jgi:hypothetical protein
MTLTLKIHVNIFKNYVITSLKRILRQILDCLVPFSASNTAIVVFKITLIIIGKLVKCFHLYVIREGLVNINCSFPMKTKEMNRFTYCFVCK